MAHHAEKGKGRRCRLAGGWRHHLRNFKELGAREAAGHANAPIHYWKTGHYDGAINDVVPTKCCRSETLTMKKIFGFCAAIVTLGMAAQAHAGPCSDAIDHVQAQVDATIDQRAEASPWLPESNSALRSHQPTPGSIAKAEAAAGRGRKQEAALAALGRARDADFHGDAAQCNHELATARHLLNLPRH
jgi:hypothetical protein